MRPLLFEQYTNVLKFESQGNCTRYVIGKDEKGSQHSPFPYFSELLGIACLTASFHLLSVGRAGGWADVGKGVWNCSVSFVPLPQVLSECNRFICARKTICCGNQLPLFISWLRQALSLLESEVLVKMQKHTFYYDLQFFREEPS